MAEFAEVDAKGLVLRVLVTDDNMPNKGQTWLEENLGGVWVQTDANTLHNKHLLGGTPLRKNYAGVGMTYDSKRDAFLFPKPFKSWLFDKEIFDWVPPISYPEGNGFFIWDEASLSWVTYDESEDL
jgi:hypothetical protein